MEEKGVNGRSASTSVQMSVPNAARKWLDLEEYERAMVEFAARNTTS
jgi:hypothetical protein